MKRCLAGWVLALTLFAAAPATADTTTRGLLNRALGNALYCQLVGCSMTGNILVKTNGTGTLPTISNEMNVWATAASPSFVFYRDNAAGANLAAGDVIGTIRYNAMHSAAYLGVATITGLYTGDGTTRKGAVVINTSNAGAPAEALRVSETGVSLASGSVYRVASDFTTAANTALQTITGLTFVLPANLVASYPFRCELMYAQGTAAVADQFGIQAASLAPTNIAAKGDIATSASATTFGNLPTLTTTTATAIVTFTPSAITTVWNARIAGLIENPSGVANTINVMVQTSTAGDAVTVKRGSYCVVGF